MRARKNWMRAHIAAPPTYRPGKLLYGLPCEKSSSKEGWGPGLARYYIPLRFVSFASRFCKEENWNANDMWDIVCKCDSACTCVCSPPPSRRSNSLFTISSQNCLAPCPVRRGSADEFTAKDIASCCIELSIPRVSAQVCSIPVSKVSNKLSGYFLWYLFQRDGAVVKAACLESRRSRLRAPPWPLNFKEIECLIRKDSILRGTSVTER